MGAVPTPEELQGVLDFLQKYGYQDTEEALVLEIAKLGHQELLPALFGDITNTKPQTVAEDDEPVLDEAFPDGEEEQEVVEEVGEVLSESVPLAAREWRHSGKEEWKDIHDLGYRPLRIAKKLLVSLLRDEPKPETAAPDKSGIEKFKNGDAAEDGGEEEANNGYEVFYLKVFHRRLHTGFEDSKDFPIRQNDIVAGRYQVVGYIGSAAFSKAVQCVDLVTGSLVCLKIIKNNKDYFDQSLDEVKLIKYINAHDPNDQNHVLQMYDFFYFKEHLFIVCELLRENLYEFSKYNRESDEEPYFTLGRLQRITQQCLTALNYIHSLKLIHCDLKPENILIQSYSRCLIRVIDFGSSCFTTDHLSSYVQSRSYRAPEVIMGLKYSGKIDVWSLGCVLAELYSGQVLFQSESAQGLLTRIMAVFGPFSERMLTEGRHVANYFTKDGLIYRKSDTGEYEILRPQCTTLAHRLGCDDADFVDFITQLLQVDPNNRPTAAEAMKHSWMTKHYDEVAV